MNWLAMRATAGVLLHLCCAVSQIMQCWMQPAAAAESTRRLQKTLERWLSGIFGFSGFSLLNGVAKSNQTSLIDVDL
jgi:hypothetical protein